MFMFIPLSVSAASLDVTIHLTVFISTCTQLAMSRWADHAVVKVRIEGSPYPILERHVALCTYEESLQLPHSRLVGIYTPLTSCMMTSVMWPCCKRSAYWELQEEILQASKDVVVLGHASDDFNISLPS